VFVLSPADIIPHIDSGARRARRPVHPHAAACSTSSPTRRAGPAVITGRGSRRATQLSVVRIDGGGGRFSFRSCVRAAARRRIVAEHGGAKPPRRRCRTPQSRCGAAASSSQCPATPFASGSDAVAFGYWQADPDERPASAGRGGIRQWVDPFGFPGRAGRGRAAGSATRPAAAVAANTEPRIRARHGADVRRRPSQSPVIRFVHPRDVSTATRSRAPSTSNVPLVSAAMDT